MGLFDRLKKNVTDIWADAYRTEPHFYNKPDGDVFGAVALTEGTKSVLLKNPKSRYMQNGAEIRDWKLVLVSTTKKSIIGDCEYPAALNKAAEYVIGETEDEVLLRGLTLDELMLLQQ